MLHAPEALTALTAALGQFDRLVLLGDLIELRQGPVREALRAAEAALGRLAEALAGGGAHTGTAAAAAHTAAPAAAPTGIADVAGHTGIGDPEIVLVPGNHDHQLLSPWLERRARLAPPPPLGLSSAVDWRQGEPLAVLAAGLAPVRLRVAYPGMWLREDVYATHGHYLDRHTTVPIFERLGAGAMERLGAAAGVEGPAEGYEAVLSPLYAWIHALAQVDRSAGAPAPGGGGASTRAWRALGGSGPRGGVGRRRRWPAELRPEAIRRAALRLGLRGVLAALGRGGLGDLRADLSAEALRRGSLAAMGEVVRRLGPEARTVLFGHTHRAGPLPHDDPAEWRQAGVRLVNCGCWVREPAFGGSHPESPYRTGFAVVVEDEGPPRLVNLLDCDGPLRLSDPAPPAPAPA